VTATEVRERNRHGRAGAVTAVTPVAWWWVPWLRAVFAFGSRSDLLIRRLTRLRIIALGRWYVLGPWRRPTLVFETNWHGHWETYIDDFARLMPRQWTGIWWGAEGFPGPRPVTRLLAYVAERDRGADHYWTAYPEASTGMALAALGVQARLERFVGETEGLGPDAFARRYEQLLADVQGDL
jgi:hypothetical protein